MRFSRGRSWRGPRSVYSTGRNDWCSGLVAESRGSIPNHGKISRYITFGQWQGVQ